MYRILTNEEKIHNLQAKYSLLNEKLNGWLAVASHEATDAAYLSTPNARSVAWRQAAMQTFEPVRIFTPLPQNATLVHL